MWPINLGARHVHEERFSYTRWEHAPIGKQRNMRSNIMSFPGFFLRARDAISRLIVNKLVVSRDYQKLALSSSNFLARELWHWWQKWRVQHDCNSWWHSATSMYYIEILISMWKLREDLLSDWTPHLWDSMGHGTFRGLAFSFPWRAEWNLLEMQGRFNNIWDETWID
jgi:hypothetical protein